MMSHLLLNIRVITPDGCPATVVALPADVLAAEGPADHYRVRYDDRSRGWANFRARELRVCEPTLPKIEWVYAAELPEFMNLTAN